MHIVDGWASMQDLGSTSSSRGLRYLRNLIACTNNLLSLIVLDILHILILPLCALPDLNLASAADDPNSHRREQVVRGVGVHVDAAVEYGGGVLANAGADHGFASWVLFDKVGDVVYDSGDGDETAAVLDLINVVIPIHDGEGVKWNTPVESGPLLVELLLHLLNTTFLDLVLFELLKIVGETDLLPHPD